ncbi:Phosphotransferase enzyme family protein [Lentzea xinjiangensis]|uniref:Phosphotransferase enzyme family protein n=1 Tax=Lentzea xinjiangensis TaxID=402600 RepID=A0A1H9W4U1_9PSEU|nr:aminoglycoside phosphotransferase family protein [Lentzea xinjiangensis]SES28932.1 Phosphotransferase enzyme family protein [Lentzea xinjiangensis]
MATFWPFRPPPRDPAIADLANLLRALHALPAPPVPVRRYQPLTRLRDAIDTDAQRTAPVLSHDDRAWLTHRADELTSRFDGMDFPLGTGLVHADAHTENVAFDDGWRLIDFDEVCLGPRELDLVGALPDHFHTPQAERERLLTAHGYDLTAWPGWTVLRDITELHSLSSYLRLAPGKPAAADQLRVRIRSLRSGDRSVRWRAIS